MARKREGKRKLNQALDGLLRGKADRVRLYPALLGAYVNGQRTIRVAQRPDFVWCRLRGANSEVVQAINETVGLHWDLPILLYRDPNAPDVWKVYGRDVRQYSDWEGASYLPPHADSHSFASGKTGIDPVWVFKRQFMPMLPHPQPTGTMGIYIEPDFWYFNGEYHWWNGSGTADLSAFRPTGASNGRFVTVYISGAAGVPAFIAGPEFPANVPPPDPGVYILLPDPAVGVPLAAVFLLSGTNSIGWGEIYDLRYPVLAPPMVAGVTGGFHILDEGVLLGTAAYLDFRGATVAVQLSGAYAQVNLTVAAGGIAGMVFWDDGVPLGTGTIIDGGYGIDVSVSGTVALVQAEPPITGSVVVLEEGVMVGSATVLDFKGAGVTVAISGSYVEVDISGGGGGGGGGGAGMMFWDDGVPLATGTIIDGGYGIDVSVSGTVALVRAEPPITGSVVVLEDGVMRGSATALNFTGAGVAVVISGSYVEVDISGGGGGGGAGMMFWDEGIPLGTGTIFNAVGAGILASLSGTVLQIAVDATALAVADNHVPTGSATTLDVIHGAPTSFHVSGSSYFIELNEGVDAYRSAGPTGSSAGNEAWHPPSTFLSAGSLGGGGVTTDRLFAYPMIVSRAMWVDGLAYFRNSHPTGSIVAMGIYDSRYDIAGTQFTPRPFNLVTGTRVIDIPLGAGGSDITTFPPVFFKPGMYWVSIATNLGVSFALNSSSSFLPLLGYVGSALSGAARMGFFDTITGSFAAQAAPGVFGVDGQILGGANIPMVFFRIWKYDE